MSDLVDKLAAEIRQRLAGYIGQPCDQVAMDRIQQDLKNCLPAPLTGPASAWRKAGVEIPAYVSDEQDLALVLGNTPVEQVSPDMFTIRLIFRPADHIELTLEV